MIPVKIMAAGVLRHPSLAVIQARVDDVWIVDHQPVQVTPGLIVAMADAAAAESLIERGAAQIAEVARGMTVYISGDDLIEHLLAVGIAVMLTAADLGHPSPDQHTMAFDGPADAGSDFHVVEDGEPMSEEFVDALDEAPAPVMRRAKRRGRKSSRRAA